MKIPKAHWHNTLIWTALLVVTHMIMVYRYSKTMFAMCSVDEENVLKEYLKQACTMDLRENSLLYIWSFRARQHLRSLAPIMNDDHSSLRSDDDNDIWGPWGPKASWHLSYRWGKTPKKLTQETCSDWGLNPGPLRDSRACYRLAHSSGQRTV